MATFLKPEHALAGGVEDARGHGQAQQGARPGGSAIKVGIHEGPCSR